MIQCSDLCSNFRLTLSQLDILALCPLDLLYLKLGTDAVYVRAPRLLKIQSYWEFFRLLDRVISSPFIVRLSRTLSYMLYMIHITACAYFAYSYFLGEFASFSWCQT